MIRRTLYDSYECKQSCARQWTKIELLNVDITKHLRRAKSYSLVHLVVNQIPSIYLVAVTAKQWATVDCCHEMRAQIQDTIARSFLPKGFRNESFVVCGHHSQAAWRFMLCFFLATSHHNQHFFVSILFLVIPFSNTITPELVSVCGQRVAPFVIYHETCCDQVLSSHLNFLGWSHNNF